MIHPNLTRNVNMIIDALPEDGSSMTITALTEACWGTSGRGNATISGMIRAAGQLGYIDVMKIGRKTMCSRKKGR